MEGHVLALAGGVGGARLARGLASVLDPERLTVAVNTGDDFEHLGLPVSPDLDTVMYTLAGRANEETGWGVAGETWSFMEALAELGGETWFRLGDKDLATHVERRRMLEVGQTLSQATAALSAALGIRHRIVPMSDAPVRTVVETDEGALAFQDYFVRRRCEPLVSGFRFDGIEAAGPSPGLAAALADKALQAVVICPSNPYVSVAPIVGMADVADFLDARNVPVVAVSPIVGGRAIKGPAAKMMAELGAETDALGIARHYGARIDGMVIDELDAALAPAIRGLGMAVRVAQTVMRSESDSRALAEETLAFAAELGADAR
ncbi:MAG: 2-phospho-L-lactate transferase [Defluviicoccus sp.]|nr:2-phospho-L-lactate transferase [Defluviicoccus sp.]MDE0386475.1 2-phospho-L-lactate transferase [Defluviicoccus sp.]